MEGLAGLGVIQKSNYQPVCSQSIANVLSLFRRVSGIITRERLVIIMTTFRPPPATHLAYFDIQFKKTDCHTW